MTDNYETFKLKVLKKVTDLYSTKIEHPPIICFQVDGNNKLLTLPPELFFDKSYKNYLPKVFSDLIIKSGTNYFCFILNCTVTEIGGELESHDVLLNTEVGKQVLKKLKDGRNGIEPSFNEEEQKLIVNTLGKERLVFLFQGRHEKDSMISFTKDEDGKLIPSTTFDQEEHQPFAGLFGNLFK